jgi:hypothetical protein
VWPIGIRGHDPDRDLALDTGAPHRIEDHSVHDVRGLVRHKDPVFLGFGRRRTHRPIEGAPSRAATCGQGNQTQQGRGGMRIRPGHYTHGKRGSSGGSRRMTQSPEFMSDTKIFPR